jgi:VanZ family protein
MKKFLALWLPVVVWMGVIFIGSSIARMPRVGGETLDGLVHRAAHLLEFAVLGALLLRATSRGRSASKREIIITLLVVGFYGVSDEFHQRFTPGRSSEGISVLFDVAGGAIGVWAWQRWARRAQPQEATD